MKRESFYMLIALAILTGCKNRQTGKEEDCSIKFPGIEFTKSINNAKDMATVEGNKLVLKSMAKNDNFNDPDGKLSNSSAPILLTRIDNNKPFTFTAKVTPNFIQTYDAGTLFIYIDNNWWFKFAFERDERKLTRIVTVRTTETSDDNNHDVVDSAGVYLKISSDTKTIGFYYSTDKSNWQLVRLFRNNYPDESWIGLSAQSPIGNGTSATFEECSLDLTSIKDFRLGI